MFISSGKRHPLWSSFQENDPYIYIGGRKATGSSQAKRRPQILDVQQSGFNSQQTISQHTKNEQSCLCPHAYGSTSTEGAHISGPRRREGYNFISSSCEEKKKRITTLLGPVKKQLFLTSNILRVCISEINIDRAPTSVGAFYALFLLFLLFSVIGDWQIVALWHTKAR